MFCPNCGKEIRSGQSFCSFCGKKLGAQESQAPVAQMQSQQSGPGAYQPIDMRGAAWGQGPHQPIPTEQPYMPAYQPQYQTAQAGYHPQAQIDVRRRRLEAQPHEIQVVRAAPVNYPESEDLLGKEERATPGSIVKEAKQKTKLKNVAAIVAIILTLAIILLFGDNIKAAAENAMDGNGFSLKQENTETGIKAGSTTSIGDLKVTFDTFTDNWTGYNALLGPSEGCRFIQAAFTFQNAGNQSFHVGSSNFTCYADGVQCDAYIVDAKDSLKNDSIVTATAPVSGIIYYEVPLNATHIELVYSTSLGDITFAPN